MPNAVLSLEIGPAANPAEPALSASTASPDPIPGDPSSSATLPSETACFEPASSEPFSSEIACSKAVSSETTCSDAICCSEAAPSEPVFSEPASTEAVSSEPSFSETAFSETVTAETVFSMDVCCESDGSSSDRDAELLLEASELFQWRRLMLAVPGSSPAAPAQLDWLLDLAGGVSWRHLQELWLHPQRPVRLSRPLAALEALWRRHRSTAIPLQYLVGRCPWRDLELSVAPGVLIPRQESELLVDLALSLVEPSSSGHPLIWADLGTGSGALALALARAWPGSLGLAVDVSPQALQQASLNLGPFLTPFTLANPEGRGSGARGADVQLRQGEWWQAIKPWWGQLHLVVCNPPYIPTATLAGLEPTVRDHEPILALDGGADGLAAIRTVIAGAGRSLAPGGVLLLEHHHDQSAAVQALLQGAGAHDRQAHRDLEGVLRFASARWGGVPQ